MPKISSSSKLKLLPNDRKYLLNILTIMEPTALCNVVDEPIVVMSDDKEVVIIGTNHVNHYLEQNGAGLRSSFVIHILENINGWKLTRKTQIAKSSQSIVTDIACSEDGSIIVIGSTGSYTFSPESDGLAFVYEYGRCIINNGSEPNGGKYNDLEILKTTSPVNDLFGFAVTVSRDGNRVYVSAPMTKYGDSNYIGKVFEFVKINDEYQNTRMILLPSKTIEANSGMCLGLELELLNNDKTLAMTCFQGVVCSYKFNTPEEESFVYDGVTKLCTIDELVDVIV